MNSNTSLARQLEKLKLPQTSAHKEKYGSVSFIYDFIEAKTIDLDTHYSNAINSLDSLIQIDHHFKIYKTTLFHESSKKSDRGVETKESNEELDTIIDELLFRISRYFQLTDAHKVLEYMIQKYHINEYNIDSLIGSILPYHETRMFVRLIQTCSAIKNPQNHRFHWMKKFQENGVPLTKSIFINHCVSYLEFTRFVTNSIFKGVKIDPENPLFPSFLASLCLNLIQRSTDDMIISHVLSVVSKCLKMENAQLYIVSYIIFSHLCNLVKLETKIVEKLLKSFIRHQVKITEFTMMAFEIVVKCQDLTFLPKNFIKKEFINQLIQYSSQYKLDSLTRATILTILSHATDEEFDIMMYRNCLHVLLEVAGNSPDTVKAIVTWMNDTDIPENNSDRSCELNCHVMKQLEKMFPDYFDLAISSLYSIKNISFYLKSIRYSLVGDGQMPLYLGIKHSSEHIRQQSLEFLAKNLSNLTQNPDQNDSSFIREILLKNLIKQDFDQPTVKIDILLQILDVKEKLFNLLTTEEFGKIALHQIRWIQEAIANNEDINSDLNKLIQLKHLLIEAYCSKSYLDYNNHVQYEQGQNFLEILFQDEMQQILLIDLISTDFILSSLILNSNYTKSNPLFQAIHEPNSSLISVEAFKNMDENEQMEQLKLLSQNTLNAITNYLHQNLDVLFPRSNLFNFIKSKNEYNNLQFILLFLYTLIKMFKSYPMDCVEERRQIVCQMAIDLLFHLLSSGIKISSHSGIKVINVSQYEKINMDEYFLFELLNFNHQRISLLIAGYITYFLIEQQGSSDDLPSTADWYLMDITNLVIYDFYYKIYCLLIHYSTPNEQKPISKKIYKFFRHLFSIFLTHKLQHHSGGLKFFLPSIVNHDSLIQKQTLIVLGNLFKYPSTSSVLMNCLKSNYQYLISYLLALISSNVSTRQMALSNIKQILSAAQNDMDELKSFAQTIVQNEQMVLTDENSIAILLGRLHDSILQTKQSLVSELFQTIIFILTANKSWVLPYHKTSLLRLLRYCNVNIKSIVFEYYSDLLFSPTNEKPISLDEESQLKEIILYYDHKIFDDTKNLLNDYSKHEENPFLKFLIKCIEKSGSVLTTNVSLLVYDLLTPARFKLIYEVNPNVALRIIHSLLRTQLELSEKSQSSLAVNYTHLIDGMQKQLRMITINGDFIVQILYFLLPIEEIYDIFTVAPKEKRLKIDKSVQNQYLTRWKMFRIYGSILSNIENQDCINSELIKILFEYLKLTFMEVDDNFSELTRQTLLYSIVNCIELKLFKKSSALKQFKLKKSDEPLNPLEVVGSSLDKMMADDEDDEDSKNLTEFIDSINVDLLIDCMLESRIKETQRISLILINLVAPHFRKQIVEYLVTIFTFIGSNLLECDDQYSLAILFETMESIIPIIIENSDNNVDGEHNKEATEMKQYITSVFIKSFTDIPAYRRLPLFTKLINLLGSERFLPTITVLLMEQICSRKSETEQEAGILFLNSLFAEFPYDVQLKSISIILCLFKNKFLDIRFRNSFQKRFPTAKTSTKFCSALIVKSQNNQVEFGSLIELIKSICQDFKSTLIYDAEKISCGLRLLKFVASLISLPKFISGVRSLDYQVTSTPLIYFINVVIELIVLINPNGGLRCTLNVYRKSIKSVLGDILLKYNALVPNVKLLDIVLIDLLNNTAQMDAAISILIKRKALELLNEKLIKLNPDEMDLQTTAIIIENLFEHLKNYHQNLKQLDDNQIHNVQLILLSLKLLTKFIVDGGDKIESSIRIKNKIFNDLLPRVLIKIIQMTNSVNQELTNTHSVSKSMQNLRTSSILCSTQILSTLSLEGIPFLSDIINLILENFQSKDDIAIISNISALYKMITNFAKFLSPHLKSIILRVLPIYSYCDNVVDLRPKLNKLWIGIAKFVPKRTVFAAIYDSYETVISNSPVHIVDLMHLFKLSCDYIEKSDVEIILKNLKNFMLKVLNFRTLNYSKVDLSLIECIETSFCEALATFIPKLTESNFRPIYYSLLEWSIQVDKYKIINEHDGRYTLPEECYHRMISFYRFCSFLADHLKSLFCVFVAPTIVQNCNQILVAYHSPELDSNELGQETDSMLTMNESHSHSSEPTLKIDEPKIGEPLVVAVLSTMAKCFLYDLNGTFVNKYCISLIVKPIVNQISNLFGSEENYEARLDLILQCTQYLIQNNKDEALIKDFNYQILLKTRESNEKIKTSAIKVLHKLILTCNEDYLPFIPEAMPFIAELSEENSDLVESYLKQLIIDVEQLIGEPINKYL